MAGRCLLFVGLGVLAAFQLFATDPDALAIGRIVGAAIALVGLFTYGFGRLVSATNRPPRESR